MLSADPIQSIGDSSAGSAVRAYTKSRSSIRINTANSVLISREQPCPVHIAGSARRLARSLMQRRRRLISCVVCSVSMFTSLAYDLRPKCSASGFGPFPQISQEFVGRHKNGFVLEDATDHNQRMRSHDILNSVVQNWDLSRAATTSIPALANRSRCSSCRSGSMVWTAFLPHSRHSLMNGSTVRYSSSWLLKKPHICGRLIIASPSRIGRMLCRNSCAQMDLSSVGSIETVFLLQAQMPFQTRLQIAGPTKPV